MEHQASAEVKVAVPVLVPMVKAGVHRRSCAAMRRDCILALPGALPSLLTGDFASHKLTNILLSWVHVILCSARQRLTVMWLREHRMFAAYQGHANSLQQVACGADPCHVSFHAQGRRPYGMLEAPSDS